MPKTINTTLETIVAAGILAAMAGIYCKITYDADKMNRAATENYSSNAPVTTNQEYPTGH